VADLGEETGGPPPPLLIVGKRNKEEGREADRESKNNWVLI